VDEAYPADVLLPDGTNVNHERSKKPKVGGIGSMHHGMLGSRSQNLRRERRNGAYGRTRIPCRRGSGEGENYGYTLCVSTALRFSLLLALLRVGE